VQAPERLVELAQELPDHLRERIARYRRQRDRNAGILGKWLLVTALDSLGCPHPDLHAFTYDARGRPAVAGLEPADFSLSHSEDLVVCAVSPRGRVGVDVEFMREIEVAEFEGVFSPRVWERIRSSAPILPAFYRHWTCLESVAKAEGFGLGGATRAIEIDEGAGRFEGREWYLREIALDPRYCCHVALEAQPREITVRECRWDL
jgi:4'-phosphopantetheinyl transferase